VFLFRLVAVRAWAKRQELCIYKFYVINLCSSAVCFFFTLIRMHRRNMERRAIYLLKYILLKINHRVGYELRFVDEHEKVSVADFFIPGHREHRGIFFILSVSSERSVVFRGFPEIMIIAPLAPALPVLPSCVFGRWFCAQMRLSTQSPQERKTVASFASGFMRRTWLSPLRSSVVSVCQGSHFARTPARIESN
jgi:hypothetical protein